MFSPHRIPLPSHRRKSSNLSKSGLRIASPPAFSKGAVVRLSFRLPGSDRLFEARAQVVTSYADGSLGLEFVDVDEEWFFYDVMDALLDLG